MGIKRALYEKPGAPEYWIADPERQTVEVLLLESDAYVRRALYRREDTLSLGSRWVHARAEYRVSSRRVCKREPRSWHLERKPHRGLTFMTVPASESTQYTLVPSIAIPPGS